MEKETLTITMRWPEPKGTQGPVGLDIRQITIALDQFLRGWHGNKHVFHCGSSRTVKIERHKKSK